MPFDNAVWQCCLTMPFDNAWRRITTPYCNAEWQLRIAHRITTLYYNAVLQRRITTPYYNAVLQRRMTTPYDNAVWQRRLTTPFDNAVWQRHLTTPFDNAVWQRRLTTLIDPSRGPILFQDFFIILQISWVGKKKNTFLKKKNIFSWLKWIKLVKILIFQMPGFFKKAQWK